MTLKRNKQSNSADKSDYERGYRRGSIMILIGMSVGLVISKVLQCLVCGQV